MNQNKISKRFLKCVLVSMIIITLVCLIHISGTSAQWSPTYNLGYDYLPSGPYGGYFEYSEPMKFWRPVLGPFLPHPSFFPPPGTPLPAPETLIPREIIELGASSNFNTAMEGYRLSIPYYLSDLMSGWTPWRSSSYYRLFFVSAFKFLPWYKTMLLFKHIFLTFKV